MTTQREHNPTTTVPPPPRPASLRHERNQPVVVLPRGHGAGATLNALLAFVIVLAISGLPAVWFLYWGARSGKPLSITIGLLLLVPAALLGRRWLRYLFGRNELRRDGDTLRLTSALGPLRRTREYAAQDAVIQTRDGAKSRGPNTQTIRVYDTELVLETRGRTRRVLCCFSGLSFDPAHVDAQHEHRDRLAAWVADTLGLRRLPHRPDGRVTGTTGH
ncbi:MAG: hypothetical protein ACF8Q5_09370 [Phycisphaerales bacterium JB040]